MPSFMAKAGAVEQNWFVIDAAAGMREQHRAKQRLRMSRRPREDQREERDHVDRDRGPDGLGAVVLEAWNGPGVGLAGIFALHLWLGRQLTLADKGRVDASVLDAVKVYGRGESEVRALDGVLHKRLRSGAADCDRRAGKEGATSDIRSTLLEKFADRYLPGPAPDGGASLWGGGLMVVGYWLREKGWFTPKWMRVMRIDNSMAYVVTGIFVIAMLIVFGSGRDGAEVTVLSFPGAWHDLVCSPRRIREEVFSQLFAWAERAVV